MAYVKTTQPFKNERNEKPSSSCSHTRIVFNLHIWPEDYTDYIMAENRIP